MRVAAAAACTGVEGLGFYSSASEAVEAIAVGLGVVVAVVVVVAAVDTGFAGSLRVL